MEISKSLVICTLFEGHYHFGVAALVNSLHAQGFRGTVVAGYRGKLPSWVTDKSVPDDSLAWEGASTFAVSPDLRLHFLPLDTSYHLTNYKPDFMLRLWGGIARGAAGMFYFDPDIVITAPWSFFDRWIKCGVALCEDVNSPVTRNHPTRVAWRSYFGRHGLQLKFKDAIYVNGGFVGVEVQNRGFLETWKNVQEAMAHAIGGLERSAFTTGSQLAEEEQGPFAPFGKTDQDALNASVEAWDGEFSLITQEGMGFRPGLSIMPHALGQPKPWNWSILKQSFGGKPPRLVDREYWKHSAGPIQVYTSGVLKRKKMALGAAALLSRFYKR